MIDLEITKLCAEAMNYRILEDFAGFIPPVNGVQVTSRSGPEHNTRYDPLHDDAQAMVLMKKFGLTCIYELGQGHISWNVQHWRDGIARNGDLNRAICECVAKMQAAKEPA